MRIIDCIILIVFVLINKLMAVFLWGINSNKILDALRYYEHMKAKITTFTIINWIITPLQEIKSLQHIYNINI